MAARTNDRRGVQRHSSNQNGAEQAGGLAAASRSAAEEVSRRHVLAGAAAAAGLLLLGSPWTVQELFAADVKIPPVEFQLNPTSDGVIGPNGEVRIFNVADGALPVIVNAAGGLGEMNLAAR
jgi:hypothetical protein